LLPANTVFRPQDGLKRADLARAMAIIQSRSIQ
jgi:hypothetical protein